MVADPRMVPPARTVPGSPRPALAVTDRKLCTVHLRVAALTIAGSLLVTAGAGGCAKFNAALGKQEAVVQFKNGTTTAARLKVRAACSHIPEARPEALPTTHLASDNLYDVIYRVDSASNAQLARLESCLQKYPSVLGVDIQTPGGS
jgi:hypothetical protein